MANINHITLLGNITRDPQLRYTTNGTAITTLGLAANHRYRQGEAWRDEVCYIDCVVFGPRAEAAAENLSKGSQVVIEGRLGWRSWEGQDGQKRSKHEVIANNVQFLSRKEPAMVSAPAPVNGSASEPVDPFDDIPF